MRVAMLALVAGCGDPALCTSDFHITLQTAPLVTVDFDPVAAGVQTPVEVATSMRSGESVLLQVLDSTGAIVSSSEVAVDAAGVATFGMVTVPPPAASLRASATNLCGAGTATVKLDVLAGATCDLAFITQPQESAVYAPLGVLNGASDADAGRPGIQAMVSVATRAGWNVELRERSEVLGDEVLASGTQATAVATTTSTVREGRTSLFAICSMQPVTLTSMALFVFADSVPPVCKIEPPDASGGTLAVAGHSGDDDIEGEPATITVTPVGGAAMDAGATTMMSGESHGTVPVPAGPYDVTFSTRDHAHNACSVTARF